MKKKLDRRVRRTRRALGHAILDLVLEKPYETITIQDITEQADLNRATFYLHFGSKEELLAASLEEHFDELVQRINEEASGLPEWGDTEQIKICFEYVAENHELYKILLGENGLGYVINRILAYIATYDTQVLTATFTHQTNLAIPIPIMAHHAAGSMFALIRWWLENDMPYSPTEMADMIERLCNEGIMGIIKEPKLAQGQV